MELLDYKPDLPGGGRAPSGGGFYHLSFRSGSRGGGASAKSACDYVVREDQYADPDRDPAIYTESGHMPSWAEGDPATFWDAADLYERENGRLYVSADFALPRELSAEDQIATGTRFRPRPHRRRASAVHAGGACRSRPRWPIAQPSCASDVFRATERRHRAIARAVVSTSQFQGSRTRRGAKEPRLSRAALGRAAPAKDGPS